jgi:CubicO group peptidase (beta-lactamase class C family)
VVTRAPAVLSTAAAAGVLLLAGTAGPRGAPAEIRRLDGTRVSPSQVDARISQLMKAAEVPGLGLAVLNGGEVVAARGYGWRDVERRLPMTAETVMAGASFSKAVFAVLVLELVDAGILDLDAPIGRYLPKPLPDYSRYADLAGDSRWEKLSARMLLSHTSGFANWRAFEDDRKLRIHFEPGSRYAYSGEGIDLLQLVVETAAGRPLEELAHSRVFGPLGMTRSSYVWQPRFEPEVANGYDVYGRSLGFEKRATADAAGSLATTVGDFARFLRAAMRGTRLRRGTWEQMLSPQVSIHSKHQFPTLASETTTENDRIRLAYGLGWGLYASSYGRAFFKEGHDAAFRNYAVAFDAAGNGVVIMTNSANGEGIFEGILEEVQGNAFTPIEWEGFTPYDRLPPRPPLPRHTPIAVDAAILRRFVGNYRVSPDIVLAVRWREGHLVIQENEEPEQDLVPEDPARFFTVAEDVYTFETDAAGTVIGLKLHADGRDIPARRVEPGP